LVLTSFDFKNNLKNPALFDDINRSTITYKFIDDADQSYLEKITEVGGRSTKRTFLKSNISAPTFEIPLSTTVPRNRFADETDTLEVGLRVYINKHRDGDGNPVINPYTTQAMRRMQQN
jgi:hypothetical protein